MQMLSEDDLNLAELTDDERERAWDLWFSLTQVTNESSVYGNPSVPGLRGASALRQAPSRSLRVSTPLTAQGTIVGT
jgi:hypothetical protein